MEVEHSDLALSLHQEIMDRQAASGFVQIERAVAPVFGRKVSTKTWIASVIDDEKSSGWLEYPRDFGERLRAILDEKHVHDSDHHDKVKASLLEWQAGRISSEQTDFALSLA